MVEFSAPRLINRRGEGFRGPQKSDPRTVRPQQSGLEHDSGRPLARGRRCTSTFCWKGRGLELRISPPHGHVVASSARRVSAPVSPFSETLICCLRGKDRQVGRAGVFAHPNREGLPIWGQCRGPSLLHPSWRSRRSPREAPSRAAVRPGGASRQTRRLGRAADTTAILATLRIGARKRPQNAAGFSVSGLR
jgi:hypothetical protein